jgi:hypothetical protein
LEDAAQLPRIADHLGKLSHHQRRSALLECRPQIRRDRVHQSRERHRLDLQLTDTGVDQHRVDEIASTLVGRAEQPQHLGRRWLSGPALEQRDEDRDVGQGFA